MLCKISIYGDNGDKIFGRQKFRTVKISDPVFVRKFNRPKFLEITVAPFSWIYGG